MPFSADSLTDIRRRVVSDFLLETGSTAAAYRGTPERGFTEAVAGGSWSIQRRAQYLSRNSFLCTATDPDAVRRKAADYGVAAKDGAKAAGTLAFSGAGATVPRGHRFSRSDGKLFEAVTSGSYVLGDSFAVQAIEPGSDSDTDAGEYLYPVAAIAGMSSYLVVDEAIAGGINPETSDELKARGLRAVRNPSGIGLPGALEREALAISGVTRAWVYSGQPKLGYATVYFVRDGDETTIIPNAGHVAVVQAALDAITPAHILGYVAAAPVELELALEVSVTPDTTAVREAVVASIQAMLYNRAKAAGADGHSIPLSWITEAISQADGETDSTLISPVSAIAVAAGEIPTLAAGGMTWS